MTAKPRRPMREIAKDIKANRNRKVTSMSKQTSPKTQQPTDSVAKTIDALVERVMGTMPRNLGIASGLVSEVYDAIEKRLREELADAVVMTGAIDGKVTQPFGQALGCYDTHTCIAFGFKPIEKPLTKAEVLTTLRKAAEFYADEDEGILAGLADRLERHEGELK